MICKLGPDTEELVVFAAHTDIVFLGCRNFKGVDLSSWNVSKVENMSILIGRKRECERLEKCMKAATAQLVVVYGRRRVGRS